MKKILTIITDEQKHWQCGKDCPNLIKLNNGMTKQTIMSTRCLLLSQLDNSFSPLYFPKEDSYLRTELCFKLFPTGKIPDRK